MPATRAPKAVNSLNEMRLPSFSARPVTVTLAEAPISVPLPPRQAPSDRAHHSICPSGPAPSWPSRLATSGVVTAVLGKLRLTGERKPDTQGIDSAHTSHVARGERPRPTEIRTMIQARARAGVHIRPVATPEP